MGSNPDQNQESFVLKWNEFHSNLESSFLELRSQEEFLDVTLALDGGSFLQGHKVILAASSPYFRSMLKSIPSNSNNLHSVLVMPPTVKYSELNYILEFVYHGEVTVPNLELDNLMMVANLLKIKGLVEDDQMPMTSKTPNSSRKRNDISHKSSSKPIKKPRRSFERSKNINPDPNIPNKHLLEAQNIGMDERYEHLSPTISSTSDQSEASSGTRLVGLKCPQCLAIIQGPEAFKQHMSHFHGRGGSGNNDQSGSSGPGYSFEGNPDVKANNTFQCEYCDKKFKSRKYHALHVRKIHMIGVSDPGTRIAAGASSGGPNSFPGPCPSSEQSQGNAGTDKKRRRRKKTEVLKTSEPPNEEDMYSQDIPVSAKASDIAKPVGQVQPTARSGAGSETMRPPPNSNLQSPARNPNLHNSTQHEESRSTPSTSRGPMRQNKRLYESTSSHQSSRPIVNRVNPPPQSVPGASHQNMDLKQSLGLKFGGHISITSSEQNVRRGGDSRGVSITKLTGDVSIGNQAYINKHMAKNLDVPQQPAVEQIEVKQEPEEDVEEEEPFMDEGEEDYDNYPYGEGYDDVDNDDIYNTGGTGDDYQDDGEIIHGYEDEELGEEEEEDFGEIIGSENSKMNN